MTEDERHDLEHELYVAYRQLKAAEAAKANALESLDGAIKEAKGRVNEAYSAIRDFGTGQATLFDKTGEPKADLRAEAASHAGGLTEQKQWTREEIAQLSGDELAGVAQGLGIDYHQDAAVVAEAILHKAGVPGPVAIPEGGTLATDLPETDPMHPRHRFTPPELSKMTKVELAAVAAAVLGPLEERVKAADGERPNKAQTIRDIIAKRDAELGEMKAQEETPAQQKAVAERPTAFCYDPRKDSAPGADPRNVQHFAHTDNPALVAADQLKPEEVNWVEVARVATYCDEQRQLLGAIIDVNVYAPGFVLGAVGPVEAVESVLVDGVPVAGDASAPTPEELETFAEDMRPDVEVVDGQDTEHPSAEN